MQTPFQLPASLPVEKLITELSQHAGLHLTGHFSATKAFYDTFDWRLYANGLVGETVASAKAVHFFLRQLDNNALIDEAALKEMPKFAEQFERGNLRQKLKAVLDMRALQAVASVDFNCFHARLLNTDEKTVARLTIEQYPSLACSHITLAPIKGYPDVAENLICFMTTKLRVTPAQNTIIDQLLKIQGKRPNDYSAKLNISLAADLRADVACKYIYSRLLAIIKTNEPGVIADIDSEFLHDFRVAVRKTRTGLGQLKGVLPEAIQSEASAFFSWLGQITGPTRDFDVYLLKFADYQHCLPEPVQHDLAPLQAFLLSKQQHSQRELAAKMASRKYNQGLATWHEFLSEECANFPPEPAATWPVKHLADARIWKTYRRVIKEGDAISDASAPEALHELRKSCKKLRYLLEFFDSLYPKKELAPLVRHLKALQEVLGNFQDFQVQESQLQAFGTELQANHASAATLMAMGMLVQHLNDAQRAARLNFAIVYTEFREPETAKGFKRLFTEPHS